MALYAFDGTWNSTQINPAASTNVVKFFNLYKGNKKYISGVGTRFGVVGRFFGGIFGMGGPQRIDEMYDALVTNWTNGDKDIDIIGFSRGAALALHFSHHITKKGIQDKNGNVIEGKPTIRFLGLWDIVGSFGIPINIGSLKFQEINLQYNLSPPSANVTMCFHAMAMHERRQTFRVTRINAGGQRTNCDEQWFRGVHSDIGGGNLNTDLSNITLQWMLDNAQKNNLDFRTIPHLYTDNTMPLGENFDIIKNKPREILAKDNIHPTAKGYLLQPQETKDFIVRANEQYSWSAIALEKNATYLFNIPVGQIWQDGGISCGPNGWDTSIISGFKKPIIKFSERFKRVPNTNWFSLTGAEGDNNDNLFTIISGTQFKSTYDRELFAFANDMKFQRFYMNNSGEMVVSVTRLS